MLIFSYFWLKSPVAFSIVLRKKIQLNTYSLRLHLYFYRLILNLSTTEAEKIVISGFSYANKERIGRSATRSANMVRKQNMCHMTHIEEINFQN